MDQSLVMYKVLKPREHKWKENLALGKLLQHNILVIIYMYLQNFSDKILQELTFHLKRVNETNQIIDFLGVTSVFVEPTCSEHVIGITKALFVRINPPTWICPEHNFYIYGWISK